MAKRIVTRIGDVFCVRLPDDTKGYFQYVANDMSQMNSSVIKVFKSHYKDDENQKIEEIVNGEVDFFAHTILRDGIEKSVWHKVGNVKNIEEDVIANVLFATTSPFAPYPSLNVNLNPRTNWYIWHINGPTNRIGILPENMVNKVNNGTVMPFHSIINKMYYGYYLATMPEYSVLKRIPRPDVHSYVKFEENGRIIYLCFWGDELEKGVMVIDEGSLKFSESINPQVYEERKRRKFSAYYWEHKNFITKDEFESQWNP